MLLYLYSQIPEQEQNFRKSFIISYIVNALQPMFLELYLVIISWRLTKV